MQVGVWNPLLASREQSHFYLLFPDMKSSKPEPGEVSSLNSSTSSKKDDSLKRDRETRDLNDSEEEEEGDLLEDEDEVFFQILD